MRIAILLGVLVFALATACTQELKIVEQKPAASEVRTSHLLFTLTDGSETFTYWHDGMDMDKFSSELVQPVKQGHLFAYARGCNLVVFDGGKRQIVLRVIMPEAVSSIVWRDGQTMDVTVKWEQKNAKYVVNLNQSNAHLPGCGGLRYYRFDTLDVSRQMERLGLLLPQTAASKKDGDIKPLTEEAGKRLETLAQLDATNPWIAFFQALYLYRSGSPAEAQTRWQALCTADQPMWYHLFRMGTELHYLDLAPLARQFHEAGMRQLFRHGFQPYMNITLIELMIHKGGLGSKIAEARQAKDWQKASALLEEYYEFAPRCEAFCGTMLAFADELEAASLNELAQLWRLRAEPARQFQSFGGLGKIEVWFHVMMTSFFACLLSIVLFVIVMMCKSPVIGALIRARREKRRCRYRILTRGALVSLMLALIVSSLFAMITIAGVAGVARAASLPLGALSKLNHPRVMDWLDRAPESQAYHFYNGLVWQMQGDYARAREEYAKATMFAQTYHNLGMIDKAEGKDPNLHFMQALAIDPKLAETVWTTRREAISPWFKVYEKYSGESSVLAMPSGDMHTQLLCPAIFDLNHFAVIGKRDDFIIAAALALCMLLTMFISITKAYPPAEECKLPPSWWLSVLLPGSSKYWSFTGCLVSALWLSCALIWWTNYQQDFNYPIFSLLEAIATPNLSKAYGIPVSVLDMALRSQLMVAVQILFYALPAVNLLALIVEYRVDSRPLPAKPAEPVPVLEKNEEQQ